MPVFSPFDWDAKAGKIWLTHRKVELRISVLRMASPGAGLQRHRTHRGQLGSSNIVRFERVGPRVLLIAPNYSFRALTNNADERQAVKDAFAESTRWGFEVAAQESGRVLVDATSFYLRDVHQVTATLRRSQQGTFRLILRVVLSILPTQKTFRRTPK